jgi:hypothetical protein
MDLMIQCIILRLPFLLASTIQLISPSCMLGDVSPISPITRRTHAPQKIITSHHRTHTITHRNSLTSLFVMPSIRSLAIFSILGASHAFIVPPMPSTVASSSALRMAGFGAAKGNDGGSKLPKLKAKAQWDR